MTATTFWEGHVASISAEQVIKQGAGELFVLHHKNGPDIQPPLPLRTVSRALIPDLRGVIGLTDQLEIIHWGGNPHQDWCGLFRTDEQAGTTTALPDAARLSMGRSAHVSPQGAVHVIDLDGHYHAFNQNGVLRWTTDPAMASSATTFLSLPRPAGASPFNAVAAGIDTVVLVRDRELLILDPDGGVRAIVGDPFPSGVRRPYYYQEVFIDAHQRIWVSNGNIEVLVFSSNGDCLRLPDEHEDLVGEERLDPWSWGIGVDRAGRFWFDWVGLVKSIEFQDLGC